MQFTKLCLPSLVFCILLGLCSPLLGQSPYFHNVQKLPFHGKLQAVDTRTQTIVIAGKNPRTFYLTPATKITDGAGNSSSLAAATIGEDVGGSYIKDTSGRLVLFSVRLGAKVARATPSSAGVPPVAVTATPPAPSKWGIPASAHAPGRMSPPPLPSTPNAHSFPSVTASPTPGKKQKFTGTIVSLSGNTLVVHGRGQQTFTLTKSTEITNAAGNRATHAALKPETHIHGTYIKEANGTLMVSAIDISKGPKEKNEKSTKVKEKKEKEKKQEKAKTNDTEKSKNKSKKK